MTLTRFSPHKLTMKKTEFLPQEEMLEKGQFFRKLSIGMPREINRFENRVILTPESVRQLVSEEHSVIIEKGVGEKSNITDNEYRNAGAKVRSKEEVYKCSIIAKVSPFNKKEISLLKNNQTIISSLHPNTQTQENIRKLISKNITAIALELISDASGFYPFVHSMSEIAGILAVTTAGKYLSNYHKGRGILLGGITGVPPAKIIILGAGTAAEYATRAAMGLGAEVRIFDNSISKLEKLKSKLGVQIFTSVFQKQLFTNVLKSADLVIGAFEFNGTSSQCKVTDFMVKKMKENSVIIDLNTSNISCFSTSRVTDFGNPVFKKYGVIHYCVPNIASEASQTASISLSNAILPIFLKISEQGETLRIIKESTEIRNGTYIYEGILINSELGNRFNIDYKDINLLTAVF